MGKFCSDYVKAAANWFGGLLCAVAMLIASASVASAQTTGFTASDFIDEVDPSSVATTGVMATTSHLAVAVTVMMAMAALWLVVKFLRRGIKGA